MTYHEPIFLSKLPHQWLIDLAIHRGDNSFGVNSTVKDKFDSYRTLG